MMGFTHIAVSVAATFMVFQPKTEAAVIAAVAGAATGGIISDIDIPAPKTRGDILRGRYVAFAIATVALFIDWLTDAGLVNIILQPERRRHVVIGAALFAGFIIFGSFQPHRAFTHSILAMTLSSAAVYLLCPPIAYSFMLGFASHLMLDVLNKKPLKLLYPVEKGFCLRLCYADKFANKLLLALGSLYIAAYAALNFIDLIRR